MMELFEARDHFIVQKGEYALWCNRFDGSLSARKAQDILQAWNPVCLGIIHGVMGKIKVLPDSDWRLVIVRHHSLVGKLPGGATAYKINKVAFLPLNMDEPKDLEIDLCSKHHFGISKTDRINRIPDTHQKALQKTWLSIKSAAENVKPKKWIENLNEMRELKEKEKFERRILEEINKMFEVDAFYYSLDGDLTSSIQRQSESTYDKSAPLWKKADERFFWNHFMLSDLLFAQDPLCDPWLIPVIQGFIQLEELSMDWDDGLPPEVMRPDVPDAITYNICLLSRRSRHRAGTRYKRRGVNEDGHCANYVETEQMLEFTPHVVSFTQVRGSVPLYWSQTGMKYKPPPRIEKDVDENFAAFERHFSSEVERYKQVCAVNLVDQQGKEEVIANTFLHHIVAYNSAQMAYVAFDFHEYCRGMKFENVTILTDHIADLIKDMKYCWVDTKGVIHEQRGVFRVNCIDCLDRTNIVQSALARIILETQCLKLGLLAPDEDLPEKSRLVYQQMWANNGDAISRQYAGTAALKGDYTRTGERKISGLMKDGVNSANRYYLNRFKDAHRQAAIEVMLGHVISEDLFTFTPKGGVTEIASPENEEEEGEFAEKEENMKMMIDECRKLLIVEPEHCLGAWGLIDSDPVTGDPTQQDMDIILLLTQQAFYTANYDDEIDQIASYQRVGLHHMDRIEIGPSPAIFKSKYVCIRIFYTNEVNEGGFFYTFRTPSTRLFNNMIINIKNEDDAKESLRAISESFQAALELAGFTVPVAEAKLDRKKTRPHMGVINIASQAQLNTWTSQTRTTPSNKSKRTKLDITRIGRTFAGLNPMRRVRGGLTRFRVPAASGLMSSVFYSKDAEVCELADEADDDAFLTKDSELGSIKSPPPLSGSSRGSTASPHFFSSPMRKYSVDQMEANLEELVNTDLDDMDMEHLDELVAGEPEDDDILLNSCGILATNPEQVLQSLIKDRRAKSLNELTSCSKTDTSNKYLSKSTQGRIPSTDDSTYQGRVSRSRDRMAVQRRTSRSLDIDDVGCQRRTGEATMLTVEEIWKPQGALTPQEEEPGEEVEGDVDAATNTCVDNPEGTDTDVNPDDDGVVMQRNLVQELKPDPQSDSPVEVEESTKSEMNVEGASYGIQSQAQEYSKQPTEDLPPEQSGPSGKTAETEGNKSELTLTEETSSRTTEVTANPSVTLPGQEQESDTWVNLNVDYKDRSGAMLYHPTMKMSFSDGSISYHAELEDLTVSGAVLDDPDEAPGSALSKLRSRMSNLKLTDAMASPNTSRRRSNAVAMQNKIRSQIRFRECQTKIILL